VNETLYEITRDLIVLKDIDGLEPVDGENDESRLEQLRQALDDLNMMFVDKVTNVVKFIKNLEGQRDAIAGEAKRLSDRKKTIDSRIDWLKNYIKTAMEATHPEKIKSALFTIYVGHRQLSVEVLDINVIDDGFIRIKKEVDKTRILEQVKSTGVIPAGVNVVQGSYLVIR